VSNRSAGFSRVRLGRMADAMRGYVERGEMAGVVQRMMSSPSGFDFHADFWTLAYQAIAD
jgi:hypothetical protein